MQSGSAVHKDRIFFISLGAIRNLPFLSFSLSIIDHNGGSSSSSFGGRRSPPLRLRGDDRSVVPFRSVGRSVFVGVFYCIYPQRREGDKSLSPLSSAPLGQDGRGFNMNTSRTYTIEEKVLRSSFWYFPYLLSSKPRNLFETKPLS